MPALSGLLAIHADMHVLVSKIPKKQVDARALTMYEDAVAAGKKLRGVEMVHVVEVVADRWEGRIGSWGIFVVEADGSLRDVC